MPEMAEDTAKKLATSLAEAAQRAGQSRGLYGAEAGALLRRVIPDFRPEDFGVLSVREFIQKHVPDLKIVGRSGSDVIYGLRDWPDAQAARSELQPSEDTALAWRVFVSPSSQFCLAIAKDGSQVRTVRRGEKGDEEVELAPAESEVHRAIAREFLRDELKAVGSAQGEFERIIQDPNPNWWTRWSQALRATSRDLNRRWFDFRRSALEKVLREKMKGAGLQEDAVEKAARMVSSARESWHRARSTSPEPQNVRVAQPAFANKSEIRAIDLIRDLTNKMSERELQSMTLLLGVMLDGMIASTRR